MHTLLMPLPINKFAMSATTPNSSRPIPCARLLHVRYCFCFSFCYYIQFDTVGMQSVEVHLICGALIVSHCESYPTTFCHSLTHSFFLKSNFTHLHNLRSQTGRQADGHGTKTVLLIFEQKDRDHTKCTCVI